MEYNGGWGCGVSLGAVCVAIGLATAMGATMGGFDPTFGSTLVVLGAGLSVFGVVTMLSGLRGAARRQQQVIARIERDILMVGRQNEGRVTPSMVTVAVRGMSLVEARNMLDRMVGNGFGTVELDDAGQRTYCLAMDPSEFVGQRLTGAAAAAEPVSQSH